MSSPRPTSSPRVIRILLLAASVSLLAACGPNNGHGRAVGTLERDRIELVAEVNEPIVEILVKEGQMVAAGDVVVRQDTARAHAQVAAAQGARDQAHARLAELERGPRAERIDAARASLRGAESTLMEARLALERATKLRGRDAFSQADLDAAQSRYGTALAARDAARANLDELVTGTTSEELDQARAALAQAEARLDDAKVGADRLIVRAPRPGLIDALPFHLGDRPPKGATVAVLLDADRPYARVYVPEKLRPKIGPGTRAWVEVDGVDHDIEARVRTVSSEATFTPFFALTERDRGRLTYAAKVDLTAGDARTLPTGVPVEVRFDLSEPSPADSGNRHE